MCLYVIFGIENLLRIVFNLDFVFWLILIKKCFCFVFRIEFFKLNFCKIINDKKLILFLEKFIGYKFKLFEE